MHIRKKFVPNIFAFGAIGLCLFSLALGYFACYKINVSTGENVFEQFYKEKYDAEIAGPLKQAKKEAEMFLSEQKKAAADYKKERQKLADEYYDSKKAEGDKYLREKIDAAKQKADEEYRKRLESYAENARKEVEKFQKKRNPKEEK